MVDVIPHECFPTIISEFQFHPEASMKKLIMERINIPAKLIAEKNNPSKKYQMHEIQNTELPYFKALKDTILEASKSHLEILGCQYDAIEITDMWANHLYRGDSHQPHSHSNNFLSGVYYLHTEENASPIQFFDPRPQASILRPKNNQPDLNNPSVISFSSAQGTGLIFPSWLLHWVPPTEGERISISWNLILRGKYGEPGSLQNAII